MLKKIIFIFIFIFLTANKSYSLDITTQLQKLADLYERGLITKEEFEKSKSIIFEISDQQKKKIEKARDKTKDIKKTTEIKKENTEELKLQFDEGTHEISEGIKIVKYSTDYTQSSYEKMALLIGDYRIYTSRPGGIKIVRVSDKKQLAVIGDKQKVKFYNNGQSIIEIIEDKDNLDLKIKLNDQIILRWVGRYVPEHKATFYQVLALNYIPFHYYVKIPSKNAVAVNMKLFNRKIELRLIDVKEELAIEYNVSVEEINEIIKNRNLSIMNPSRTTDNIVDEEINKVIDNEINKSIDKTLMEELEQTIGQAIAQGIIEGIEEATNQAIDDAIENEIAAAIDSVIQEAINEGISEAAISAGLAAFFDALASGASFEEAIAAGDAACAGHGGC